MRSCISGDKKSRKGGSPPAITKAKKEYTMLQQISQVETLDKQIAQIAQFRAFVGMMKEEGAKMDENERTIEWTEREYELRKMLVTREAELDQVKEKNADLARQVDEFAFLVDELRAVVVDQSAELAKRPVGNGWNIPQVVAIKKQTFARWS